MNRIVITLVCCFVSSLLLARDNGQYAQVDPAIKDWIIQLHAKGSHTWCCDIADGEFTQQDIRKGADGDVHWFVSVGDAWVEVPDEALVDGPNILGRPIVWSARYGGQTYIRCFLPGALG